MRVTVFAIHRARCHRGTGVHQEETPTDRVAGDEAFPGTVCNANPTPRAREVCVEIVVTGRNVEIPDHFREHIADKVARLERYDHKIVALEVELFHERNRRQLKSCQRVEITGRGGLGVARAEACAQDFYAALDAAVSKLEARMRRSHDRRRVTGRRTRVAAGRGNGVAVLEETVLEATVLEDIEAEIPAPRDHTEHLPDEPLPGRVVPRRARTSAPMSLDDALSHMELRGHDFYLFADVESGQPSVVYRKKGYDYGVIRLSH
jgi:ribosomal subunit interface protein